MTLTKKIAVFNTMVRMFIIAFIRLIGTFYLKATELSHMLKSALNPILIGNNKELLVCSNPILHMENNLHNLI